MPAQSSADEDDKVSQNISCFRHDLVGKYEMYRVLRKCWAHFDIE